MPKADHSADRVSIAFRLRGVFGHALYSLNFGKTPVVSIAFRLRGVFGRHKQMTYLIHMKIMLRKCPGYMFFHKRRGFI